MIRYRAPRRGGFTLIELLTVIAILAILSALVAAGIGRVRTAQQSKNAEATLIKLQQALDAQRKAVIDQCKQDRLNGNIPQAVLTFCNNDKDMAEAVWVYANLKREFPETFAEALGDFCPNTVQLASDKRRGVWLWFPTTTPATNTPAVLLLQPRATFAKFSTVGPSSPPLPQTPTPSAQTNYIPYESAALLYVILAEKGAKGVSIGADEATAGAQTSITFPVVGGTVTARVFTDTWGSPIWFNRLANFGELQTSPFVSGTLAGSANRDPIDPLGKLFTLDIAHKATVDYMASTLQTTPPSPSSYTYVPPTNGPGVLDGSNKLITVYSAGPNKQADVVLTPGNTAADDIIGYRLRRQGASGG